MKALITGGCGFIGSHLAIKLAQQGHQVIVIDNLSSGGADVKNLSSIKDRVEIIVDTIENYGLVKHLAKGVDTIFHLATQCLVMGMDNPVSMHETNDVGTFNVCMAAREHGCSIVMIGTSEQYGTQQKFPINEQAPLRPCSLYALTKVIAENLVRFFHDTYSVPAVLIRPFNTFGPLQREDLDMERLTKGFNAYAGVITSFIKRLEKKEPPIIFGDGFQSRDFSYVSDIVDGMILLSKLENCEVVNLGSGTEISVKELAFLLGKIWGLELEPIYGIPRINDIRRLLADISLAKRYGYAPKISFEQGLRKYVEWYKSVSHWK